VSDGLVAVSRKTASWRRPLVLAIVFGTGIEAGILWHNAFPEQPSPSAANRAAGPANRAEAMAKPDLPPPAQARATDFFDRAYPSPPEPSPPVHLHATKVPVSPMRGARRPTPLPIVSSEAAATFDGAPKPLPPLAAMDQSSLHTARRAIPAARNTDYPVNTDAAVEPDVAPAQFSLPPIAPNEAAGGLQPSRPSAPAGLYPRTVSQPYVIDGSGQYATVADGVLENRGVAASVASQAEGQQAVPPPCLDDAASPASEAGEGRSGTGGFEEDGSLGGEGAATNLEAAVPEGGMGSAGQEVSDCVPAALPPDEGARAPVGDEGPVSEAVPGDEPADAGGAVTPQAESNPDLAPDCDTEVGCAEGAVALPMGTLDVLFTGSEKSAQLTVYNHGTDGPAVRVGALLALVEHYFTRGEMERFSQSRAATEIVTIKLLIGMGFAFSVDGQRLVIGLSAAGRA